MRTLKRLVALTVLKVTYQFGQRAALPWRPPIQLGSIDQGWPTPLVEGDSYRVWLPLKAQWGRCTLRANGWGPLEVEEVPTPPSTPLPQQHTDYSHVIGRPALH